MLVVGGHPLLHDLTGPVYTFHFLKEWSPHVEGSEFYASRGPNFKFFVWCCKMWQLLQLQVRVMAFCVFAVMVV